MNRTTKEIVKLKHLRLLAAIFLVMSFTFVFPTGSAAQGDPGTDEDIISVEGPFGSCEFHRRGPSVEVIITTATDPPLGEGRRVYCQASEGFRLLSLYEYGGRPLLRQTVFSYIGDPRLDGSGRSGIAEYITVYGDGTVADGGGYVATNVGVELDSNVDVIANRGVSFALTWFTATDSVDGTFANMAAHHGGRFRVMRGGIHVRAHIATVRSPVQHWARPEPVELFRIPDGYRPHVPIVRTQIGTVVNAEGIPVDPTRRIRFEITVSPDGAVRYVDGKQFDDASYLAYDLDLDWETSVSPDRAVLAELQNSFPWKSPYSNWGHKDIPLNGWEGVSTDAFGRVTYLDLFGYFHDSKLPPVLDQLKELRTLILGDRFDDYDYVLTASSETLADLGNLPHLETLVLDNLPLTGPLPAAWSRLTNLRTLTLFGTEFTGPLPPEWSSLRRLEVLDLSGAPVEGQLPPEWSGMENLERLELGSPFVKGHLPTAWADMQRLRVLNIWGTPLTGSLPPEWSQISRLEYVGLRNTNVNPAIPASWGMIPSLQEVRLGDQRVDGATLRQQYLRDMLRAGYSRRAKEDTTCRDGHWYYLYYCSGSSLWMSVGEIPE